MNGAEEAAGLPPFRLLDSVKTEAFGFLEINAEDRRKLSPDQCGEASLCLAQYAFYVNRLHQRASARVRVAEDELNKVIAPMLCQYDQYMKVEDKRRLAIGESTHATALESARAFAEAFRERTAYLSQRIHEVAEAYKNLSYARKREQTYG